MIVGDKPSKKNTDPNVPFVGTKSYTRLLEWIKILELEDYKLLNSHSNEDRIEICKQYHNGYQKVIALGNNAKKALDDMSIKSYKLPHPSGRNRQLNNKQFLMEKIVMCITYLYSDK